MNHLIAIDPARRIQRQALPGELIDDHQDPVCTTIVRAVMYEVIAPTMVPPNWPQANTRRIVQP